ncbi:MAG: hypothetical protein FJZ98_03880 [Chloroflexi bacterium]|nr:hypothetical protein [Chloroflexota bacterium]
MSPSYLSTAFERPLSIDDKITIFIDRTLGWQLDIADKIINGETSSDGHLITPPIQHSGIAVLHIVLSYFEMIAKTEEGYVQPKKSEEHFKRGVLSVFPSLKNPPVPITDELLKILYSGGRCELYHGGLTDSRIVLIGDIEAPMGFDPANKKLLVNPHRLVPAMKNHLRQFESRLRDPNNKELRESFEKRFDYEDQDR